MDGHEVLRTAPYHCDFNAIELVCASAKKCYNDNIGRDGYGADKTIAMWNEALGQCDAEFWNHCVNHAEKNINDWYEREKILDVSVNHIVINITMDNSDSSSNNSDSG
ncbi:hypothetical protein ILUMI_13143 [Ignelater luminosus]|uniref:Uncharacterized protein n=1 Tax=Ignelater luminosus TaxID=2038154 RepID=A0A8K0CWT1_IGNLU|nr:hypothetical protein ILUMI_13143 [Ignelater luminosus]